jgi:hypothetical protein
VITAKGQVHGKTLTAIRDRIDRFHAMNVFGDADAAAKLAKLRRLHEITCTFRLCIVPGCNRVVPLWMRLV